MVGGACSGSSCSTSNTPTAAPSACWGLCLQNRVRVRIMHLGAVCAGAYEGPTYELMQVQEGPPGEHKSPSEPPISRFFKVHV